MAKLSNQSDDLRAMLAQALQAYELTRIAHLQATALAKAEQERISHLLTFIEQVRQASRDLLEKASLAYIAGAPLQLDKSASPVRSNDKAVAAAFSEAQLAYIDLRTALFQLAAAFLDSKRWEQTRRAAQPLLEDTQAPLFIDARNLLYESHYQAALSALEKNDIAEVIRELHQLALLTIRYKKTAQMLEEIFVREELFTRLSNADAWDLVAQIFLILQAIQGTNLLMRQRLDGSPELRAAMKAITEIEFLWSTNTSVLWTDQHHTIYEQGLRITGLTFSESANLIALVFQADGYEGQYHSSGVIVVAVESGQQIFEYMIHQGEVFYDPIQVIFFENDEFLHIYTRETSLRLDLFMKEAEPSSSPRKSLDDNQAINSLLLSNIKRKVKASTKGPVRISPNGLYVAVAVEMKLYMFRKTVALMEIVGRQSEQVQNNPKEEPDE